MTLNFRSPEVLRKHIRSILDFYIPNAKDISGGFNQNYLNDGTLFNTELKHLVSSCRMVFNFAVGEDLFQDDRCGSLWKHGLEFIRSKHWQNERQGYAWTLNSNEPDDETNHCYGLAFVLLCFSTALKSGDESARADVYHTYELLEKHFWLSEIGLYADEISPDWQTMTEYRGQNANMHACEAMILAYEATDDDMFLDRAYQLAKKISVEQADKSEGIIWEHFNTDLSIDWEYNKDDPKNLYRPWGFQPGHQTEWTKLLLMLHKHKPEKWMIARAKFLFDSAVDTAWDEKHGGLFYGFSPQGVICDQDKYFWVQAESFAAAALLAQATNDERYWQWYDKLWSYSWEHFVDHENGAWFRVLNADNTQQSDKKSEAGAKCDYHTLGACALVLSTLEASS
jgi:mannose/cellobiose epimerase-like protein (N-acyl-D-glucosamine 2-epimerase family)